MKFWSLFCDLWAAVNSLTEPQMWCVFPCRLLLGAGRLTLAIAFGFDISPDRWQIHTMSALILKADIHERGRHVCFAPIADINWSPAHHLS
jgi:hypothetical protein